jgi:hypothetical protein
VEIEVTLDDENESPAIGAIVEYVYDDGTQGFGGVDDQVAMLKNIYTYFLAEYRCGFFSELRNNSM